MRELRDKRVLITGGAGGMGMALARRFAADGAIPLLGDVSTEALESARSALLEEGIACHVFPLDVTRYDQLEGFRQTVHDEAGPIDVLINNAGVVFGGPFLDVPLERHLLTYAVNTTGLMAVAHTFLTDLVAAPESHLVNVASASGFVGLPYGATYASSKWAVIGLSESIRLELERSGHEHVGVTTVCPSYVDTGMFTGVRPPRMTKFLTPERVADKIVEAIRHRKVFVLEPWLVKLTPFLAHALPKTLTDRLADFFGATTGMSSWRGHEPRVAGDAPPGQPAVSAADRGPGRESG